MPNGSRTGLRRGLSAFAIPLIRTRSAAIDLTLPLWTSSASAPKIRLRWDLLRDYGQYWFVSITPYGRDIEPNVPDKHRLIDDFKRLSDMIGADSVGWRFDPIFLSDRYTMDYQLSAFDKIATALDSYTQTAVISFIDLYPKVRRNFPEAREVTKEQRLALGKEIATSLLPTVRTAAAVCGSAIMRKPSENI